MKKLLLSFVAAMCCAMLLTPQKALAIESYGTFWVGETQYYFEADESEDLYYATLTAFKQEVTGHVVIPETFDFNAQGETKTWTVTGVAGNAFGVNCNVTSVDLPGTILSVTESAFANSANLKNLIIRANVPPVVYNNNWQEISDTQLFNTMLFKGVYVPNAVVQDYKDNSNWGKTKIYPISEFQGIDDVQGDKVQSTKVLRDGILYIERNGKTYTATGVEVK